MSPKLSLVLFLVLVLELTFVISGPALKSNYIEQENSCREVCGLCDCDGFYCEEECICECNIKDEDNLQCIAEMKTECDKNGLEYELLMQEETKDRFLRQIKPNMLPFENLSKNLVIIKKKREETPDKDHSDEVKPDHKEEEEPVVGAPQDDSIFSNLHLNIPPISFPESKFKFPERIQFQFPESKLQLPNLENFEPKKLMFNLQTIYTTTTAPTTTTVRPSFSLPSISSLGPLPPLSPLPSLTPLSSLPSFSTLSISHNPIIVQPPGTL